MEALREALGEGRREDGGEDVAEAMGGRVGNGGREALPGMADYGPAVVVGSGGSGGGRRWCLQPLDRLEVSAAATGTWLGVLGLDPSAALLVNPLPWHHVSGLMPWLRARQWGAEHAVLAPELLRQPNALAAALPLPRRRPALLSLVPTQLHRLLADPAGVDWLRGFAVIWVGGAPLASAEAERCRREGLRLAPCYGSTETGSMVTALAPDAFLGGVEGCGLPLAHARVRVAADDGAVEVRATSLSPGHLAGGCLCPLAEAGGWWRSGDRGRLAPEGLTVLGRLDGAVHSGGETVFPEQVEAALHRLVLERSLPVEELLVVARLDREWGERLVGLVRLREVRPRGDEASGENLLEALRRLALALPAAQRPADWRLCPELRPNALGKWERARWRAWVGEE
ncbi:MAG: AMP-binding protein [Cyanobacteria bacterium K_Offshore_surface_m2_239]|nr:AMP-binding protein [Cyanobacteria bacterium K_Offshore_surface_m2_239]